MRTAHEHVGGHLSLRHKKGERKNVRARERVICGEKYSCCAAVSCEIRAASASKKSQLEGYSMTSSTTPTLINRTLEVLQINT